MFNEYICIAPCYKGGKLYKVGDVLRLPADQEYKGELFIPVEAPKKAEVVEASIEVIEEQPKVVEEQPEVVEEQFEVIELVAEDAEEPTVEPKEEPKKAETPKKVEPKKATKKK